MSKRSTYFSNKKILVTGGHGFLGSHLVKKLEVLNPKRLFIPTPLAYDLRSLDSCLRVVRDMDIVIHLAAKVGGIGFNQQFPGEMFYDNVIMSVQLMEEARKAGVKKFVSIGTVCSYPKITSIPFKEENFWNGYPEETNAAYGLAKKMSLVQGQAYRKQYGFNAIYLIPVNLYSPRDNFDLHSSHVIPALIKKFIDAKEQNKKSVVVWGTGTPTREFLYVEDAADVIVLATERYDEPDPVNIGSGTEISIQQLAETIRNLIKYQGEIVWDRSKPDGQPRRKLDTARARRHFGFQKKTNFVGGLKKRSNGTKHTNVMHKALLPASNDKDFSLINQVIA